MTTLRQTSALLLLIAMLLGVSAPRRALADYRHRRVGVSLKDQFLQTTFSYRDVFTPAVQKKIRSGLPTRLLVQVMLENHKQKPVALWAKNITVVYDLWEEDYAITVEEPRGKRRTRVRTIDEAMKATGILWRTPVASVEDLAPGRYRLKVIAEANPVSMEMVRNIQRWISRPSGGGYGEGGAGGNYFGSFVGYFVDRSISRADKTVQFVSQWFLL